MNVVRHAIFNERMASIVKVYIPIVAHLFGGSEKESLEIGTGDYNKKTGCKNL
jgi:hypothetical protein